MTLHLTMVLKGFLNLISLFLMISVYITFKDSKYNSATISNTFTTKKLYSVVFDSDFFLFLNY